MNAIEFHKLLHEQVKTVQSVKTPEIQNIIPLPANPDIIPRSCLSNVNQSQFSFPWIKLMLVVGAIILVISLVSKIPKSENYQSYFERVRKRSIG